MRCGEWYLFFETLVSVVPMYLIWNRIFIFMLWKQFALIFQCCFPGNESERRFLMESLKNYIKAAKFQLVTVVERVEEAHNHPLNYKEESGSFITFHHTYRAFIGKVVLIAQNSEYRRRSRNDEIDTDNWYVISMKQIVSRQFISLYCFVC